MDRNSVRRILLENQAEAKMIRLDDGREFRVRGVEFWATSERYLIVIDSRDGCHTSFPYRKIASIKEAQPR